MIVDQVVEGVHHNELVETKPMTEHPSGTSPRRVQEDKAMVQLL